ncbi:hypothetical protein [Thermococcus thioreducens]|uniref:Uncharacterized protein n=1 Tax=Thermococcus thioreducens TaxID=277988 RepID=A0A0Q2XLV8_9EURY|nr:hypothetical protein [Thermococcus thioreducens]ASJ11855.1 hypothetical protein A3L14_02640 [Thermococcus thioreducens]KQH82188.1 hypothetical protein AMR53_07580 [Thermococcus thioreducens]SEW12603.1 hypothetical protein SAMN05216170_1752 [Thermococcus thioreducens]
MKRSKTLYSVFFLVFLLVAGGAYYFHTRGSSSITEPQIKFNATSLDFTGPNMTLVYKAVEYSGKTLIQNSTRTFIIIREGNTTTILERFKIEWQAPDYSISKGENRAEIVGSNPIVYQSDGSIFVEGERAEVELFRVGYPYSPVFERLKAEKGYTLTLCCANLTVEDVRTINGRECIIVKAETRDAILKLAIDAKTRLLLWDYGVSKDVTGSWWEDWLVTSK